MFSLILTLLFICNPQSAGNVGGETPIPDCQNQTAVPQASSDSNAQAKRAKYPNEWERPIPKGTKLDALRQQLDREFAILPERDLDDRTPIPIWFRVYLRKKYPDLPTSGPYQYPRTAQRILQRLLDNPNSVDPADPK